MNKVYAVNIHSDDTELYGPIGDRMMRVFSEEFAAFMYARDLMDHKHTDERVFIESYDGSTGEFLDAYREYAIEKYVETMRTSVESTCKDTSDEVQDRSESKCDGGVPSICEQCPQLAQGYFGYFCAKGRCMDGKCSIPRTFAE